MPGSKGYNLRTASNALKRIFGIIESHESELVIPDIDRMSKGDSHRAIILLAIARPTFRNVTLNK